MSYVSFERLYKEKKSSLYKLVLTAATRANELAQGAQPLVKTNSKKVSTIALREIQAEKVSYEQPKAKGKKSST